MDGLSGSPPAAGGQGSLLPGQPWPMGATVRDGGVNFAVPSTHASAVELCLLLNTLLNEGRTVQAETLYCPGRHRTQRQ